MNWLLLGAIARLMSCRLGCVEVLHIAAWAAPAAARPKPTAAARTSAARCRDLRGVLIRFRSSRTRQSIGWGGRHGARSPRGRREEMGLRFDANIRKVL